MSPNDTLGAPGRNAGCWVRSTTAGSTTGDHGTFCSAAERDGRAAKSQPPALLHLPGERVGVRAGLHEGVVVVLVSLVSAQAFPGEAFDGEVVEIIVAGAIAPTRCVRLHFLGSASLACVSSKDNQGLRVLGEAGRGASRDATAASPLRTGSDVRQYG